MAIFSWLFATLINGSGLVGGPPQLGGWDPKSSPQLRGSTAMLGARHMREFCEGKALEKYGETMGEILGEISHETFLGVFQDLRFFFGKYVKDCEKKTCRKWSLCW